MRIVKLNYYKRPDPASPRTKDHKYSLMLGNRKFYYFDSSAKTKRFLAEVSRYLTYKLHEINMNYGLIFSMYRECWVYLDVPSQIESKCEIEFNCIDDLLHRVCFSSFIHSMPENGDRDINVYHHLMVCAKSLKSVVKLMKQLIRNKSMTHLNYRLDIIEENINRIIKDFDGYNGPTKAEVYDSEEAVMVELKAV